ncbi:metalloprotease [Coemansia sp. RSA 2599]|nr:metalloprotease [Coemansia sp. RSA 2599]
MLKPFSTIFIFLAALLVSYQLGGQGLKQWFDCYYSRPSAVARQYVNGTNSVLKSSTPVIAHPGWDTGFELRSTVESNMAYYEYTGALEKSPTDPREFRLIRLKNNMTVVCIHDPDSVDSAASLSVNIGHEYNPPEFLGLAHFLEHMLFQVTYQA